MNRVLICLILGLSLSAQAAAKKNATAPKKKLVAITFSAPTATASAKTKMTSRNTSKTIRRPIVDAELGSSTLESEIEPLKSTDKIKTKKSLFVGPLAPPEVVRANLENRQMASLASQSKVVLPKEAPELKDLLKKYQKNFETEAEDDLSDD